VYDTQNDVLSVIARERREQIQREMEAYHYMTEAANLTFGPGPVTRTRRAAAELFHKLAHAVAPPQDRSHYALR